MIILTEIRMKKTNIMYITNMQNRKYDTNELIYETDSQT